VAASNKKTNACRVLDTLGISYELRSYPVDESDLSTENVARKLGVPNSQLYKTLCLRADDKSVLLAVIGGDRELDLKALARSAGKRAVEPVQVKELQGLTGYVRGGCTALACKKPYPVFVDEQMLALSVVSVSAGQRGLQIWLPPADYVRATGATVAPISRAPAAG
jgi:Cys-tRNA(Pro)/Cys-tRNA(Cys) deacylase